MTNTNIPSSFAVKGENSEDCVRFLRWALGRFGQVYKFTEGYYCVKDGNSYHSDIRPRHIKVYTPTEFMKLVEGGEDVVFIIERRYPDPSNTRTVILEITTLDPLPEEFFDKIGALLQKKAPLPKDFVDMKTVNFMQVMEQSDEEKLAMYMKLPQEELCKMLIERNKHLSIKPKINYPIYKGNGDIEDRKAQDDHNRQVFEEMQKHIEELEEENKMLNSLGVKIEEESIKFPDPDEWAQKNGYIKLEPNQSVIAWNRFVSEKPLENRDYLTEHGILYYSVNHNWRIPRNISSSDPNVYPVEKVEWWAEIPTPPNTKEEPIDYSKCDFEVYSSDGNWHPFGTENMPENIVEALMKTPHFRIKAKPHPVKRRGWVNVLSNGTAGASVFGVYSSEEDARNANTARSIIDTIEIEWTEQP